MQKLVWLGIGGLFGTLSRYWISQWVDARAQSAFPLGTLVVNLSGCFAAGFLFQLFERAAIGPDLRLAAFSGFLGAFTTFSAFGLQTVLLAGASQFMAVSNVIVSNVAGLAMVWMGAEIGRRAL